MRWPPAVAGRAAILACGRPPARGRPGSRTGARSSSLSTSIASSGSTSLMSGTQGPPEDAGMGVAM
eukprot:7823931-Alexandrium_andersonii.AAC.1